MRLLDLLHDYLRLRAKAHLLPLGPEETERLGALTRLLKNNPTGQRREAPRFGFPRPLPVTIAPRGSEGFASARLREIGAEGAALELERSLPEGRTIILYFDDDERGLRFELPAVVLWQTGSHAEIRFEGMPTRRTIARAA